MTGPTRIGANLLWLVPGVVGGSEEYTLGLLRAWADRPEVAAEFEMVIYANPEVVAAHGELLGRFPLRVSPTKGRRKAVRVLAEQTWLARRSRADEVAFVHHFGGTMPFVRSQPGVVTVHDLQPWAMPEHFSWVKRQYLQRTVPCSVDAASAVVTLSDWAKRDLVTRLAVDAGRVVRVPPGVTEHAPPDAALEAEVLAAYELAGCRFFLYPAITYEHKDHAVLVEALAALGPENPTCLILTGGSGPAEDSLRSLIAALGVGRRVRRTGRIPAAHLDVLYRRAEALTFPSRYEGFGLPALEAMSRGCPVISSDAGALPEVVGDGGVVVPVGTPDAWRDAMASVLVDSQHRADLVDRAIARASTFSWPASVDALLDAYRMAVHDLGRRA